VTLLCAVKKGKFAGRGEKSAGTEKKKEKGGGVKVLRSTEKGGKE